MSDAVSPLVAGEGPTSVVGLARSLAAAGSPATVLSLAPAESVAALPGFARRLRTISVRVGERAQDIAFFEGKAPQGQVPLIVAGATGRTRAESALLLAEALRVLTQDGLLKADVAVGWGETAAPALSVSTAAVKIFVAPSGRLGGPLGPEETDLLANAGLFAGVPSGSRLLAAVGATAANAVVAPSPSAARSLEREPALSERASDEPVFAIRFGCDESPHDPSHDSALPATFSTAAAQGKQECRKSVIRRRSLAVGPRTLLLGTAPLRKAKGGDAILDGLAALGHADVAILIPGHGDVELMDRARRLAIGSPGRWAFMDPDDAQDRLLRAAADAIVFGDADDRLGRAVGLAQLYGALPIALGSGAVDDFLVDYDPASSTGSAILFGSSTPHEIVAAVGRAVAVRNSADDATALVQGLMRVAPRWTRTAAAFEEICASLAA